MKKILCSLFVAIIAMFTLANAQTVEQSKFMDNTKITLKGGVSALAHPGCNGYEDWAHTLQGTTTLEFSKMLTPKFGVGLESTVGWENGSQPGFFQGRNWLNYVNVLANAKFNLNNMIHGYKGTADKIEFVPTVGIGWVHGFTYAWDVAEDYVQPVYGTTAHSNDIMTKYTMDINYNVNDRVQLNLAPYAAFNLTGGYQGYNAPRFDSRNMWYGVEAGISLKLGNEFKLCDKVYTQAEWDALNAKLNEARSQEPQVVIKERIVEKVVTDQSPVYMISFDYNSAELDDAANKVIASIPANSTITIKGEASNPGSSKYNKAISEKRAKNTADAVNKLEKNIKIASIEGLGETGHQIVTITVIK
jgi:outer membrane protein OmpA-like peptidoglycan-associated protein